MKKTAIILTTLTVILAAGCDGRIKAEQKISARQGGDYTVEKLFTVDGCTVYRFNDCGFKYFTNCKGSTQWTESSGKTTTLKGVQGGQQ